MDLSRLDMAIASWGSWGLQLQRRPVVVEQIFGGYTNQSFLVDAEGVPLIVRLNSPKSLELGINRNREYRILKSLDGYEIAPKWIYWDKASDSTIMEYIHGRVWTNDDIKEQKNIELLEKTISRIQTVLPDIPEFNYVGYLEKYWQTVVSIDSEFSASYLPKWSLFLSRLKEWQELYADYVLTHHDFVPANIIETNKGLRIIDWEYAGYGMRSFDLQYILYRHHKDNQTNSNSFDLESESLTVEMMAWLDTLWEKISGYSL